MKKIIYSIGLFSLVGLLHSCVTTDTELNVDKVHKILPNGMHLEVEKTNRITHHKNLFTHRDLGDGHSYTYKFKIKKGDVNWDGGTGEPKHLVFCKDSVYLHYLKEKHEAADPQDTLNNYAGNEGLYKIHEIYEVFVDERYFFKLFGEAYWVEVSPEVYTLKKATCTEYEVPNDNELKLSPVLELDTEEKPVLPDVPKGGLKSK